MKNKVIIVYCLILLPGLIVSIPFNKDQQDGEEYHTWDRLAHISEANPQYFYLKRNVPYPKRQNFETNNNYYNPRLYPNKYSSIKSTPNDYKIQPKYSNTFLNNENEFMVPKAPRETSGFNHLSVYPNSHINVYSRQNNMASPISNVYPSFNYRKPILNNEPSNVVGRNDPYLIPTSPKKESKSSNQGLLPTSSPKKESKSSNQGFTVIHPNGTVESFKNIENVAEIYPNYIFIEKKGLDRKNIPLTSLASFFNTKSRNYNQDHILKDIAFNDKENQNFHKNKIKNNSNKNTVFPVAEYEINNLKEEKNMPNTDALVKDNSLNLNTVKSYKEHNNVTFSEKNESDFVKNRTSNSKKSYVEKDGVLSVRVPAEETQLNDYESPNLISINSNSDGKDNFNGAVDIDNSKKGDKTNKTENNYLFDNNENYLANLTSNKSQENTEEVHINYGLPINNYESYSESEEKRKKINPLTEKMSDSTHLLDNGQVLNSANSNNEQPNIISLENIHSMPFQISRRKIDDLEEKVNFTNVIIEGQIPLLVEGLKMSSLDDTYSSKVEVTNKTKTIANENSTNSYVNSDRISKEDADTDKSTFKIINLKSDTFFINSGSTVDDKNDAKKSITSEKGNINNGEVHNKSNELSAPYNVPDLGSNQRNKEINLSSVKKIESALKPVETQGSHNTNKSNDGHDPVTVENLLFTRLPVITPNEADNANKVNLTTVIDIPESDLSNDNHEEKIISEPILNSDDTKSLLIPIITPELHINSDKNKVYSTISKDMELNLKHVPIVQLESDIDSENKVQNINSIPVQNYDNKSENRTPSFNSSKLIKNNYNKDEVFNTENNSKEPNKSSTSPKIITGVRNPNTVEAKRNLSRNSLSCNSTLVKKIRNKLSNNDNAELDAAILSNNDEEIIDDSDDVDSNSSETEEDHGILLRNKKNELLRLLFGEDMDSDSVFIFQIQAQPLTQRSIKKTIFPNGTIVEEIIETA